MIVYGIQYKGTNKIVYIGQTIRPLSHRWTQHLRDSKNSEYPIHRVIQKYGKDNFKIFEIENANSLEELNKKEIELINKFNTLTPNGYNLMLGQKGGRHSEETKEKLKKAAIKNNFGTWERTEENNLKNKERALKQHSDPVFREKFLTANGSKEFNVFKAILIQNRNNKGQKSLYEKGEFIGEWFCASNCAKDLKITSPHIISVLKGKRKTHSGYIFEYKEK